MELDYTGILAAWYDSWLVVIGLAASLALTLMVMVRGNWRGNGLVVIVVMVLAVLAGVPLTMMRIGMDLAIDNPDPVGYLSLVGTVVAIALGAGYLYLQSRSGDAEPAVVSAEPSLTGEVTGDATGELEGDMPVGDETLTMMDDVTPAPGVEAATLVGEPAGLSEEPAPQESAAWIHFTAGPRAGQSIPLPTGTVNLGRGMENDVVLDDATVSRNHATIAYQDGEYYIEDAGSMSGTMVEGVAATRTLLASGATLKMGEAELVFMQTEPGAAGAAVGATGTGGGATGTGAAGPGETVVMQQPQSEVMAWLAVTSGPSKGKTYQLREGENTIGRSSDNDLAIEDTSISRSHAMVRVQDDRFVLVDLGSRGGTKVGDRRLEGRTISTGGVVTVGQTRLNLVEVEGQEPLEPGTMSGQTIVDLPGGGSAVLIAQSGPDSGRSFPLAQGDNSIGRDPDSEVLLTDDAVSRRHALIRAEQDGFVVFDLGSRSGTLVDGEAMTGQELSGGDTISVGRTEVVLMQPGS